MSLPGGYNVLMNKDTLLRLWGKTDKKKPDNYHPMLFHLLDVGHVMQRLWPTALSPGSRQRLAQALGLAEEDAARLIVLLAAQHDLGKASAFQYKDAGLWRALNQAGLTIGSPKDQPHGYVSAKALPGLAQKGIGGWKASKDDVARGLAKITGGHHGTFPTSADLHIGPLTLGDAAWDAARAALLRELVDALFPDANLQETPIACSLPELTDAALVPLLGGLISVADWVGSSRHFPPTGWMTLEEYLPLSRARADAALADFGWSATPQFAPPAAFGHIFRDREGKPLVPNAMQQKVVEWATAAREPYLLIIETAMGSGKTEAALYAADHALSINLGRGFYVALPTQATGNAMFKRVEGYLKTRGHGGPLNLQLVHAGALLSEDFEALRQAADALNDAAIYDDVADPGASMEAQGQAGRVIAEGWFTSRKRPLLATFGVGTIDQSLLGILQTRHWFVRLLGLAGKVVVFDEVHAYDVYMSTLLGRLLAWLRALDCTVILLSATLPASARNELLTAWQGGSPPLPPDVAYPRLTLCRADAPPEAVTVADPKAAPQEAALGWIDPDWASVLRRMRTDLPDGGCALLLCNTVTRAQDAFRALSLTLKQEGWEVKLFHARTPAAWRQERERWVLDTFGKDSTQDRRDKKILLIATQVVEQSLDLDFDWIASEMAPGDLLLQRLGRLWRHLGRWRAVAAPRFVILCGQGADGFPIFPDYAELIYDRYVLLRSWLAVNAHGETLALPAAIDPLVQEVYRAELPEGLSPAWVESLQKSLDDLRRKQQDAQNAAQTNAQPAPEEGLEAIFDLGSTLDHVRKNLREDDDPRTHETMRAATRLGDPSVGVICLGTDEGGQSLATLSASKPDLDAARTLLGFGLSLSHRGLYHLLAEQDAPKPWRGSALLRYHRALEFDQGRKTLGVYVLRLNRDEGLVIEKQGQGTEE